METANNDEPAPVDPPALDPPAYRALLKRFYEQHHRSLERWLRTKVPPQEAGDVLQDGFASLLGAPPPEKAITNVRTFIHGALNFSINDWFAQRTRRQELEERLARFALEGPAQLAPSAEACALLARAVEIELDRQLKRLGASAPQALLAFELVKLGGMTEEQVAQQMRLKRRQVSRWVVRILRILQSINQLGDML